MPPQTAASGLRRIVGRSWEVGACRRRRNAVVAAVVLKEVRIHSAAEERRTHSLVAEEEADSSGIHRCPGSIATPALVAPLPWGKVYLREQMYALLMRGGW